MCVSSDGVALKRLEWVVPFKDDLIEFPEEVKDVIGYALQKRAHHGVSTPERELKVVEARLGFVGREHRPR